MMYFSGSRVHFAVLSMTIILHNIELLLACKKVDLDEMDHYLSCMLSQRQKKTHRSRRCLLYSQVIMPRLEILGSAGHYRLLQL